MSRFRIHQFRAGAPDKFNLIYDKFLIKMYKHDNQNLVDWEDSKIVNYANCGDYMLPADEGDIRKCNNLKGGTTKVQSHILLPNTGSYVIDYNEFVPKDSQFYVNLKKETGIIYEDYSIFKNIDEFLKFYKEGTIWIPLDIAIKTVTGSGSRGVILNTKDPNRLRLGGKYCTIRHFNDPMMLSFIDFARKENCRIMLQSFIPLDGLTKINVDFVIRNGKLLTYKWDVVDPSAVFTNWNWLYVLRNKYTDSVMKSLTKYIIGCGIKNAIMNFEAFSDNEQVTHLVEMNWRYSNSMFEWGAFDIDPLVCYLTNTAVPIPMGKYKLNRFWTAGSYDKLENYDTK
jgi:hypothetical protein